MFTNKIFYMACLGIVLSMGACVSRKAQQPAAVVLPKAVPAPPPPQQESPQPDLPQTSGRATLEHLVKQLQASHLSNKKRLAYTEQINTHIASNLGFEDAEALWLAHQNDTTWAFVQPMLAFKLSKIYYHTRAYDRCEALLKVIQNRYPTSPFAAQATDFLKHMQARSDINPRAVGVVLPLSGKYQQYGERTLQAIQLALQQKTTSPLAPIALIVKDSQADNTIASQMVEQLVLDNHVIAIIGPIFSNEAMSASLKAEELGVPMLSLSHREGLAGLGSFIFRTALTISAQAKALADVACDHFKFSTFAILYPKSRYGIDFMHAFWNEIDKRHGQIRGVEAYEPDQTTFREPVRKLVGRWFLTARNDYKNALDNLQKKHYTPLRMRRELDNLEKTIAPIVDFEALIIPDSGKQIGLIAPALAFEDIVLTHDPKMLEKMHKIPGQGHLQPITLMGASTWNSSLTLDSCENYCEDAIFVDAYFTNSPATSVLDFASAFVDATHGTKPALNEAQAYDTMMLLRTVLDNKKPQDRAALREALLHNETYQGITGNLVFDEHGEVKRDLFVLTIKDHAIGLLADTAQNPNG